MTSPLYMIARWCLSTVPVDAAGRRCFDETLADWRKEAAQASSLLAALVVPVRAVSSVLRCLTMVSLREIRSHEGAALLLRLAAVSIACVLLFIGIHWNDSMDVEGTRVPMGPVPGALVSVASILGAMPFLAFLCAGFGRRLQQPGPRLGPALITGAMMFVAMGWAMPLSNQAYREFTFALSSTGPLPMPGINERSFVELVEMLFTHDAQRAAFGLNIRLIFTVAAPVMLVLGTLVRTLSGWRRVAASVLPMLVLMSPALIGLNRIGEVAWWPALLGAALITRALTRRASEHNPDREVSTTLPRD